jgi:hypothetical protein
MLAHVDVDIGDGAAGDADVGMVGDVREPRPTGYLGGCRAVDLLFLSRPQQAVRLLAVRLPDDLLLAARPSGDGHGRVGAQDRHREVAGGEAALR